MTPKQADSIKTQVESLTTHQLSLFYRWVTKLYMERAEKQAGDRLVIPQK